MRRGPAMQGDLLDISPDLKIVETPDDFPRQVDIACFIAGCNPSETSAKKPHVIVLRRDDDLTRVLNETPSAVKFHRTESFRKLPRLLKAERDDDGAGLIDKSFFPVEPHA